MVGVPVTITTRWAALGQGRGATATELTRQNPMAREAMAWWPGGRAAQNAAVASPRSRRSTASSAAPAARAAASYERRPAAVSASSMPPPPGAEPVQGVEVAGVVGRSQLLRRGRAGLDLDHVGGDGAGADARQDGVETLRVLGVAGPDWCWANTGDVSSSTATPPPYA